MTFTCIGLQAKDVPLADNVVWKHLQERANLTFEMTEFKGTEMNEKASLIITGGDYPDFFFKASALDANSYGEQGIFIPLEDLIKEYMPNLTALLDKRDAWGQITHVDGHVYSLPNIKHTVFVGGNNAPYWINKKWIDNLGLEVPTNAEELRSVLLAFKEKDANGNGDPNDEIPFSFENNITRMLNWVETELRPLDNAPSYFMYDDETREVVYYASTDEYKERYLKYFRQLAEDETLNVNGFTMTSDQVTAEIKTGLVGMYTQSGANNLPDENKLDYVILPLFRSDLTTTNSGVSIKGMSITDKCENPEILCAWADFLYTEEGGLIAYEGIEGETYTMTAEGKVINKEKYPNHTYQATLQGAATVPCLVPDLTYRPNKKDAPHTYHCNEMLYGIEGSEIDPAHGFFDGVIALYPILTQEENERKNMIATNIDEYANSYAAKIIVGELSLDDSWDDYIKTLKNMGVEELVKIYQDAVDRLDK